MKHVVAPPDKKEIGLIRRGCFVVFAGSRIACQRQRFFPMCHVLAVLQNMTRLSCLD
ncbi:MAG: hypothetical protein GXY37_04220 [Chloroflexi bacterium]|nr:hypothetical protein [Chloroflexota bacterium]